MSTRPPVCEDAPSGAPAGARKDDFVVERSAGVVRLSGAVRMQDAAVVWHELHAVPLTERELTIDLSGVERIDGGVIALIVAARAELAARGMRAEIARPPEHLRPLVELYGGMAEPLPPRRREHLAAFAMIGTAALGLAAGLREVMSFLGSVAHTVAGFLRRPRLAHLADVPMLVSRAGTDALPIVTLIAFLVGFVMGYQSARQLERFGANVYVADLVSIAITRELAPLMTAIIVAGRSGAAYAAEIATMKVSDEIDALRTMGLDPIGWLVIPRILALVLVVPVLTLVTDVVGVLGGLLVAVISLDVSARAYVLELKRALVMWDVAQGLVKSVPFAITIALIACQQGFAASGAAESVGRRTTATVVTCLFSLVVLDALFTVTFRLMGK